MDTNSTRNEVEQGAHLAVRPGSPDSFHSGDSNSTLLHGDGLDIGTCNNPTW